jgi:hypothetical protein
MRTFRLAAESDREHRLIFQAPAEPQEAPAAPPVAERPADAPVPVESEEAAQKAAEDAVNAADRAFVETDGGTAPAGVRIDPADVPPAIADPLRQTLQPPRAETGSSSAGTGSGLRYDQIEQILEKEVDGPNGLVAQKRFLEERINSPTASERSKNRAKMNLGILDEMIAAKQADKPLDVYRREQQELAQKKQAEQAKIAAAERAANPPAAGTEEPAGKSDEAVRVADTTKAELEIRASAEDALSDPDTSDSERGEACYYMLRETNHQLENMGEKTDLVTLTNTNGNPEDQKRLMTEVLTAGKNGKNIDALIREKQQTFDTGEKATLEHRLQTVTQEKIDADVLLAVLSRDLNAAKTAKNNPTIKRLEEKVKEAEIRTTVLSQKLTGIALKLKEGTEKMSSDIDALKALKENADRITSSVNVKIRTIAAILKKSAVANLQILGNSLDSLFVKHDGSLGLTVDTGLNPWLRETIVEKLGGKDVVLINPPRLLSALADVMKKEPTA